MKNPGSLSYLKFLGGEQHEETEDPAGVSCLLLDLLVRMYWSPFSLNSVPLLRAKDLEEKLSPLALYVPVGLCIHVSTKEAQPRPVSGSL